jgi:hypothetical protein
MEPSNTVAQTACMGIWGQTNFIKKMSKKQAKKMSVSKVSSALKLCHFVRNSNVQGDETYQPVEVAPIQSRTPMEIKRSL